MATIYIAGDGSGDYNCDGVDDHIEINDAFAYADSNPGTTVYFKGPFKYVIGSKLLVGSSVTITGDSTACIKLKDSAGWATGIPLIGNRNSSISNVEIFGFEIDGNDTNQAESRGDGYYMNIYFTNATNCTCHDMYIHDSLADGFRIKTGSNARFYNNTCKRLGHDASYFEFVTGGEVFNNYTEIRTNSAHRVKDTSNVTIHDNNFKPYALTSISGGPGIEIEDSTGNTANIEVYNNVMTDCWAEGIWVIEYGTGNTNQNKNLYIHNNTIKSTGRITTINYHAGITIQGFTGARIEDNIIDSCYNAGVMCKYAPLSASTIYLTNNVIKNTKKTLATQYLSSDAAWTGTGVVNHFPASYTMVLNGNSVTDSAGLANYYQVDYSNDKVDTSDPHYTPPAPYAPIDTGYDYYVDGRSAYINGYPFNWTDKKIDVSKTMGQLKSPGVDGWSLEDFGFGGADITLDCFADSFTDMRQAIAAFYQDGRSVLELGGIYAGYRITGYTHDHSTNLRLSDQNYEYNYPYSIGFTADQPIMETVMPRVRGRKVTADGEEWSSDNIFTGNNISNFDFENWTNVKIGMSWHSDSTPSSDENEWRYVCWSPELNLFCAVAQTGTDNRVMTSPDGITWTRQTLTNANRNQQWRCVTWATDLHMFVAVGISGTGYRVMTSHDGVTWTQRATPANNSWISVAWANDIGENGVTVGSGPVDIVINPAGTVAYVSNYTAGTVSVIDLSTNTVTDTITVGSNPTGLAITPDGSKLYVAKEAAAAVAVITTSNNTITSTIPVTSYPQGMAVTPDGSKLYVCNRGSSYNNTTLSVITVSTGVVAGTITVGAGPTDVKVSYDGSKAYAVNAGSGTISVIDVAAGTVSATISNVGDRPYKLALQPGGTKAYVTCIGSTGSGSTVTLISTANNTVTKTINNFSTPTGIAATPDGSRVYVTNNATHNISVISTNTDEVTSIVPGGAGTGDTYVSVSGPKGVAVGSNNKLYVVNNSLSTLSTYRIGRLVAIAVSGTGNRVMTSFNGTDWTIGTSAGDYNWTSICWSPTKRLFVAVAYGGASNHPVMTSPDGITWSLQTLSNTNYAQTWCSVCWSTTLGLFCAVSENGTTQQVMTSPDGITWTARTTPYTSGRGFRSVVWAHELGIFVAVANSGTQDRAMYSKDGINWVATPTPVSDNNWYCIAWAPGINTFAAVAMTGTADRAMYSSDYGTLQTHNVAPDNWTLVSEGQEMTEAYAYSGTKSYLITGDGLTANIGCIQQAAFIEPDYYYVLGARAKVVGLTQGALEVQIFSGNMIVATVQFTADTTDWALGSAYFHFDEIPSDAVVRILGTGTVNAGAKLYVDYVTLQKVAEHDQFTLGNDLLTSGTVNVTPEVLVSACPLVGGVVNGGTYDVTDPNVYSNISTSYLLDQTWTIPGKLWKKFRLDTLSAKLRAGSGAMIYAKYTVQAASLFGGVETAIIEWSTNSTSYITKSINPALTCGTNETLVIKLYVKTTVTNTRVYVDDPRYVYTEIGSTPAVT
ncbi:MAG: right-handed parallel beta-helix repeat-containing protein, partial [Candidatus Nanoarchaeia archaeon]|nr:right-handed parallel beta-helix repeat-containing protein [Candidatus Nanoarchaeia archaeon]